LPHTAAAVLVLRIDGAVEDAEEKLRDEVDSGIKAQLGSDVPARVDQILEPPVGDGVVDGMQVPGAGEGVQAEGLLEVPGAESGIGQRLPVQEAVLEEYLSGDRLDLYLAVEVGIDLEVCGQSGGFDSERAIRYGEWSAELRVSDSGIG